MSWVVGLDCGVVGLWGCEALGLGWVVGLWGCALELGWAVGLSCEVVGLSCGVGLGCGVGLWGLVEP